MLADWAAEAESLMTEVRDAAPLLAWPASPPEPRAASARLLPSDVVPYLVGRGEPLAVLAPLLCTALGGETAHPGREGLLTVDAARSAILDVAQRRCVTEARPADADALENDTPSRLWRWDLRDARKAPGAVRDAAAARKKRTAAVSDRLAALAAASAAVQAAKVGAPLPARARKALERLEKTGAAVAGAAAVAPPSPGATSAAVAAFASSMSDRDAARAAAAAAKVDRARAAAEREALKAAREREKLEREKERSAKAAAREAEKAEKAAAKEAAKAAKAAAPKPKPKSKMLQAFGSEAAAKKSASVMASFIKRSPKSAKASPVRGAAAGAVVVVGATPAPRRKLTYHDAFPPAPPELCAAVPVAGDEAAFAAALAAGGETAALAAAATARWKAATKPPLPWGAPPSWSRRADALEAVEKLDRDPAVRLWRRKFIWHAADSARPAYTGSCVRPPAPVSGRRPTAHHPELDYEVASDEEWEEEPEGEDLSDRDDADDEPEPSAATGASVGDGFFVDEDDDAGAGSGGGGLHEGADAYTRLLAAQLDTARRGGRLALVSRLRGGSPPPPGEAPARGAALRGDRALLAALAARPWRGGAGVDGAAVRVTVPPPTAEDGDADAPAPHKPGGRAPTAPPADLAPALREFLCSSDLRAAPKVAAAFMEAHVDRKMTKKWVLDEIKAAADWKGGRWVLKEGGGVEGKKAEGSSAPSAALPAPLDEPWAALVASLRAAASLPDGEAALETLLAPVAAASYAVPPPVVAALVSAVADKAAPRAAQRAVAAAAATALGAAASAGSTAAAPHASLLGGGALPAAVASLAIPPTNAGRRSAGCALLAAAAQAAAAAGPPAAALATALALGRAFAPGALAALAMPTPGADVEKCTAHAALALAALLAAPDAAGAPLARSDVADALAAAAAAHPDSGPARGLAKRGMQGLAALAGLPGGAELLRGEAVRARAAAAAAASASAGGDLAAWAATVAAATVE